MQLEATILTHGRQGIIHNKGWWVWSLPSCYFIGMISRDSRHHRDQGVPVLDQIASFKQCGEKEVYFFYNYKLIGPEYLNQWRSVSAFWIFAMFQAFFSQDSRTLVNIPGMVEPCILMIILRGVQRGYCTRVKYNHDFEMFLSSLVWRPFSKLR